MGDRPKSFPRSARVRTNVRRKDYDWFVGLVYYPRELSRVTTARPGVPGVLQYTQGGGGIGYLHCCSRLKCTYVLILMVWYSHNAHGMVQEECGDAMPSNFSDLSRNAQYRRTTSEGLAQAINRQGSK
jgi:hypothetical protein